MMLWGRHLLIGRQLPNKQVVYLGVCGGNAKWGTCCCRASASRGQSPVAPSLDRACLLALFMEGWDSQYSLGFPMYHRMSVGNSGHVCLYGLQSV